MNIKSETFIIYFYENHTHHTNHLPLPNMFLILSLSGIYTESNKTENWISWHNCDDSGIFANTIIIKIKWSQSKRMRNN